MFRAEWGPMTASTSISGRTTHNKPRSIGELRSIPDYDARNASISVKNELRRNLLRSIEKGDTLFPGVHGYEDTVVPQIVNALLSRHNFILLGLRGQAKSRILRGLAQLLDAEIPLVAGCEINDDPLHRPCKNHYSAERSHRRRNPHPLSVHTRRGHDHHPTRSVGQSRSGSQN